MITTHNDDYDCMVIQDDAVDSNDILKMKVMMMMMMMLMMMTMMIIVMIMIMLRWERVIIKKNSSDDKDGDGDGNNDNNKYYRKTSNISRTKSQDLKIFGHGRSQISANTNTLRFGNKVKHTT